MKKKDDKVGFKAKFFLEVNFWNYLFILNLPQDIHEVRYLFSKRIKYEEIISEVGL